MASASWCRVTDVTDTGARVIASGRTNACSEGCIDGNQTSWLTTVVEGIGGLLHWNGSDRSAVSGARSRTRLRRGGHVRTGRPYAWHTHPLGQTLVVTAGFGRVQRWGGPIEEIQPGDVVWFPPGEKHWHGASPTTALTHIAVQEQLDGKNVEWMEQVRDDQYLADRSAK